MSNALELIENKTALELFGSDNSLDKILDGLEKDVLSIDTDISSLAARKNVASIAYKVAKTKTTLDALGKGLTDEARKQIGLIDAGRRKMRDRLDALKDEVRKPLTEWEDKEKDRVAAHEEAMQTLTALSDTSDNPSIDETDGRIKRVEEIHGRDWEEFQQRADGAHDVTANKLNAFLLDAQKRADEQAELEKLRQEKEARELKDREDQIARDAAAAAQKEAEERAAQQAAEAERKASAERDNLEREAMEAREAAEKKAAEAEKKARDERDEIERKASEASEAAARKAAEDQAKIAAAETARKDAELKAEQSAQAERDRIEAENLAERQQTEKREADKKHRAHINNTALEALSTLNGISKAAAKSVVEAIAKGEIPNVKISY